MTYRNINKIEYPYLRTALLEISKKHPIESVYIDPKGELGIIFKGRLFEDSIVDILKAITPKDADLSVLDSAPLSYYYSYEHEMKDTQVYSLDGIDYQKL